MRQLRLGVALCLALLAAACGSATTALDVGYPDAAVHPALLASSAPRRVQVDPVVDRRMDPTRIGAKGKDEGTLVTSRPVTEIVRAALASELAKNGHAVVADRPDVVLAVAVEAFGLDAVEDYPGRQYVGKVVLAVTVSDGPSGAALLTRRYVGIRRRQMREANERDWRDLMDTALARAMHDLATDPDLTTALKSRGA